MAETILTAAPALDDALVMGPNRVAERGDLSMVSVAIPQGGGPDLEEALQAAFALAMPAPLLGSDTGQIRAISSGADQILLVFPHTAPRPALFVAEKLAGAGYAVDQTDALLMLEIVGPDTPAALERLCPLDFRGMGDGAAARTVMDHIAVTLLRCEAERFQLICARSFAHSLLHAVETAYRDVIEPV
ncbi:MAG: hypothetical protein AAGE76_01470 [Pseudomonadota bacterium]